MRIISQDGVYDYPYEQSVIVIDKTEIRCCLCVDLNDVGTIMARYSTEVKAKKVMEMLHREWDDFGINGRFQFPSDDEVEG